MISSLRGALLFLATATLALGACGSDDHAVTVLAASSLQDVLPQVVASSATLAQADLRISYAASSTLARQLEAGAGGDIFLSANVQWVDRLAGNGILDGGTRREIIGNRLVLVATPERALALSELPVAARIETLIGSGDRLAMGDPAHVPAGIYGRGALQSLGLWDRVEPHCAFADNVRAALALVARGEAPLGIVYATDAALDSGVVVIDRFEPGPSRPIVYSFARKRASSRPQVAAVFDALTDANARRVFSEAGFVAL